MRRQIPHLHVLGHPLSKNGHVKLLCDTKALQAAPPQCRKRTSSGISEDQIMVPRLPRVTTAKRFSPSRLMLSTWLCGVGHGSPLEGLLEHKSTPHKQARDRDCAAHGAQQRRSRCSLSSVRRPTPAIHLCRFWVPTSRGLSSGSSLEDTRAYTSVGASTRCHD